jgi:hypothetical protein
MLCVISDLRRNADEICAFLGNYAACIGNPLPTFQDYLSVLSSRVKNPRIKPVMLGYVVLPTFCLDFLTAEDGTDRLFRNVGDKLPIHAA